MSVSICEPVTHVADDACATLRSVSHEQAVLGNLRVAVANVMDGSEDNLITRYAASCWFDAEHKMPQLRQAAIEEVDRLIDEGRTWDRARELIRGPPDPGRARGRRGQNWQVPSRVATPSGMTSWRMVSWPITGRRSNNIESALLPCLRQAYMQSLMPRLLQL